jgi:hypothetical protein
MVDYKLRLGDGTTFSVDEKGLKTWLQGGLVDDKARVQPAGSKTWFTLKQVLAAQGAQRGHAVRQTEQGRAEVDRQAAQEAAEIERKVAEQRAAEKRKAADDLAAAERKAAEARNAAERKLIGEREAAERRAAEERAAVERAEAEAREAARVAEAERLVAAERAERAERKRKAEEARLEAEQRAAEEARLAAERKAAEERAAEKKAADARAAADRKAAEARAAADRKAAEAKEAAAREKEREAAAERAVAAERAERAEKKRRAEEERLAEQRADEPPATEIAIEPAATMVKVEDFERELGLVPVAFTDGAEPASRRDAPADRGSSGASAYRVAAESSARSASPPSAVRDDVPVVKTPAIVDAAVMRVVKMLDRAVVWVVKSLAPLLRDAVARSMRSLQGLVPKVKGLLARKAAPAETSVPDAPTVAPAPWSAPPPPAPRSAPAPAPSAPREPPPKAVPPPSMEKVKVIPFADGGGTAPSRDEEVWDGEDAWEEPGPVSAMFAVVWLWVKRVTITAALIAAAAALYLNKEKWLPQSKSAAIVLGQQVDKLSEQMPRTIPPEAIEAARAQVPYLRADTIELVMAKSTQGVLEPAELFRRAHLAAERARPSLPQQVAAEIDHHIGAVAAELEPDEGEALRAYLAALRRGTPTLAYQDKEAVWLMGRGVRRFPPERIARMQELFAQAVTMALQPPP